MSWLAQYSQGSSNCGAIQPHSGLKIIGYQYAVEMNMPSGRSTAWVKQLPEVVSGLNNTVTRLIGKKPADAIREKAVSSKPSTPYMRPVGVNERKLPPQEGRPRL